MIHLYIVRHGETAENAAGILQGHLEGMLNEKGRAQAAQLRDEINGKLHPDRLIASDLKRTVATAEILNEIFHLPLERTPLIRERDWGEYTGRAIPSLPKGKFPPSVESIEHMMLRANTFLQRLAEECVGLPETHILIVSHGVFSRCLQAAALHQSLHDIPILKNLEMRRVLLSPDFKMEAPDNMATEYNDSSMLRHGKES